MRLREGRCTAYDYDLLSSRVMRPSMNIDFSSEPWRHAPVIVYDNATKDAINIRAASAFAKETGQQLQWYYAEDKCQQKPVTDRSLRDYLNHLPSGQTQQ